MLANLSRSSGRNASEEEWKLAMHTKGPIAEREYDVLIWNVNVSVGKTKLLLIGENRFWMGRNNWVDKWSDKRHKVRQYVTLLEVFTVKVYLYYYARSGHNSVSVWLYRLSAINDFLAVKHDNALIDIDFHVKHGGAKKRGAKGNGSWTCIPCIPFFFLCMFPSKCHTRKAFFSLSATLAFNISTPVSQDFTCNCYIRKVTSQRLHLWYGSSYDVCE